ncbi:MAG: sulfatase-like hydrolase/transferase [Bacteroidaceae bacterium]|nr:sulfatase-like hydrolase/transferase [Bacteroidaceae bacterium]
MLKFPIKVLANVVLAYAALMVCRLLFVAENWSAMTMGWGDLSLWDLVCGSMLFDTSAFCYLNALWLLLVLLPLHWKECDGYHTFARIVFVAFNGLGVVMNLTDSVYFQYTGRRTTATVMSEFAGEDNLAGVFGIELLRHWYLVVAGIAVIYGLWRLYTSTRTRNVRPLWLYYALHLVALTLTVLLSIAGMRGGVTAAVRPITISNAAQYVNRPAEAAMVLNTPFSVIRTIGKTAFPVPEYFDNADEVEAIYSPVHECVAPTDSLRPNIVILILESFGREYIGALNETATGERFPTFTPFVDSLCRVSLTFDYSFCNGRKSIDAMPSILSSIPMFVEPFILTPASMNRRTGIASELAPLGYYSAFFHGAQNGSMGFQAYARSVGFRDYFGRTEYNADPATRGDDDFDGMWAIWDEPFLQFYARTMGSFRQPFVTGVFTATSHHPYAVPDEYKDIYRDEDDNANHKCIRYVDNALRRFFETASRQPWYANTIFVLTSDHTNLSTYAPYATDLGGFCSPIVFFDPSGRFPRGRMHKVAQHIDIMPTLLDYVGATRPYVAFGKSLLADTASWAVNQCGGVYQYVEDTLLLQFDGDRTTAVYDYRNDWMQTHNLVDHPDQPRLERRLKAIIQDYMQRMNDDRLTTDN